MRKIIIALPKGQRLLAPAYHVFKNAGYPSCQLEEEIQNKDRKLLEYPSDNGQIIFLLVRVADIPQYIDKNWADIGISAFDCYREYELSSTQSGKSMRGDNFITDMLPDLKLCRQTRFCVAGRPENQTFYEKCKRSDEKILTAATQHPYIAAKFFSGKGITTDIITISGSSELMPKYSEVDVIFDLVETGRALEKNGLVIFEEAMPIQTKILVSKAALKYDENIKKIMEVLQHAFKP